MDEAPFVPEQYVVTSGCPAVPLAPSLSVRRARSLLTTHYYLYTTPTTPTAASLRGLSVPPRHPSPGRASRIACLHPRVRSVRAKLDLSFRQRGGPLGRLGGGCAGWRIHTIKIACSFARRRSGQRAPSMRPPRARCMAHVHMSCFPGSRSRSHTHWLLWVLSKPPATPDGIPDGGDLHRWHPRE